MMSTTTPVRRTREHVDREYNREKWPAMERRIEDEIAAEPDGGLARILGRVGGSQWRGPDPLETVPFVAGDTLVHVTRGAAYGAEQGAVIDAVFGAIEPDTDLVVEMGSGFGWHLLTTFTMGGPRDALYVAAEYTAAGRRAATRLAGLDDRLRFEAIAFDYHDPSFDGLPRGRHAVVFSGHSLEQIPSVTPRLFEAIRGLADRVTVLHFEPVGWQVGPEHDGRGTSRAYADTHDYTRDLVPALRAEEAAGQIAIDAIVPDVFGINPRNSTTVIRWRSSS